MTAEDDKKDAGLCTVLGRWAAVGSSKGCCIASAPNNKAIGDWLQNWTSMADLTVELVLDDNKQRKIILKTDPTFTVDYPLIGDEPKEGESLFWITYKFLPGFRMQGLELFANLTEEQDKGDCGANTPYCRYHNIGTGSGMVICSSKSAEDVYGWCFNWIGMCELSVIPVCTDKEVREVICGKPDFAKKQAALFEKMAM